ncbi:MAG: peptidylprolyl isomerase [Chlorobiaceae bacterium]
MKKVLRNVALMLLVGNSSLPVSAFADVADRIVAVVGNEVIFKSEIDSRELMTRMQYPQFKQEKGLSRSILDGVIDQKILLAKAKIDSVSIDENAVVSMANDRFKDLNAKFASKAEMESRLGKSSAGILEAIRQELRNQQLVDTLRRKKSAGVTVSYDEVMAFYAANKEQFPLVPEEVSVSQILKYPPVSEENRAQALATIERIRAELKAGADFSTLAKQYSQDPGSAKAGGDLGFVPKGQLIPSFENVAYALGEGKISDIVETRYGYHLIQLLSKEPNSIHVRHILIVFDRKAGDFSGAVRQLDALRADVLSGKDTFAHLAKKYSEDPASATIGGQILLGTSSKPTFSPKSLRPQLQQIIATLKSVGDISEPQKIEPQQGEPFYAIFRLNERIAEHKLNPEKDYAFLEEQALANKNQQIFNQWVQQLRKEVYVRTSDI